MNNPRAWQRLTVKAKILLVFLSISMAALGIVGFAAFSTMSDMGTYALTSSGQLGTRAVSDSTTALEANAESSLLRLAMDQADISNVIFEQVNSEMETLAGYASTVHQRPGSPATRVLYSQSERPPDPKNTSNYFLAPGVTRESVADELSALSETDDLLLPLVASDTRLTQAYIGTGSGILWNHPWDNGIPASYDPRLRDWFISAREHGHLVWSDPYVDAGGKGLMVTCSRVAGMDDGKAWVVGADVTLDTINTQIINTQVSDRGYALLIDSRGNVISRPGIAATDRKWDESFTTENLLTSNNEALSAVARDMVAGKSGTARVPLGGEEKYIAYAPLKSVNWSLAIVMPVDDIIAPAKETRARIVNATGETGTHLDQQMNAARNLFFVLFVILFIIVTILSILFAQIITRPVEELRRGAEAIGAGDLDHRVQIETGDEFEDLAHSFNTMAVNLKNNMDELQRTTAEKERFAKELEIAKGIQQSFLPDCAPEIAGIELVAKNVPALEVGGDFYDFIPVAKDRWGLVIADVSGKGVPAALFMALSRTLIRASTLVNADPALSIAHANRMIYEDSKSSMFVTLFYAVLDARAMTLDYVNAGHNPPLLLKDGALAVRLLKAKGIALGVIDEVDLQSVKVDLKPGDVLVLYTDGVTEAINNNDEEFGEERLFQVISANRNRPAQEIMDQILAAITAHAGDHLQYDDITIMVLRAV
ncbi:SpoIIE family protein phosphatase [Methanoregula sp.]|uniref:SpoIIE family protein phosphatase n=1 Tax=Methanoregula sp. TaxID=2052170 RepID=UPI00237523A4|nr:SpoIIE family protein phosphatase [Methanoregula sp.]MDD1686365.1 SpoIIE family protein phosphatase [Methanoregula sp.]